MTARTGAGPQRGIRSSQLLFGWQARHGLLDAYTGQEGRFSVVIAGAAPTMDGRNGATSQAGHAMPRWEQITGQGPGYGSPAAAFTTRLAVVGDVGGQDVERLEWDAPWRVMALSIYVRCWPLYTPGADVGLARPLLSLGDADTGGGLLVLQRVTTKWEARRIRLASEIYGEVVEPGTAAYPMDVLATLSAAGQVAVHTRDAAGVLASQLGPTDASFAVPTEMWADGILYTPGGAYRYETIKIARGVQTFAAMDALS